MFGTTRRKITLNEIGIKSGRLIYHDFLKHNTNNLLKNVSPDVIINCVGITIRRGVEKSKKNTELINSRLPHFLDEWSNKIIVNLYILVQTASLVEMMEIT